MNINPKPYLESLFMKKVRISYKILANQDTLGLSKRQEQYSI